MPLNLKFSRRRFMSSLGVMAGVVAGANDQRLGSLGKCLSALRRLRQISGFGVRNPVLCKVFLTTQRRKDNRVIDKGGAPGQTRTGDPLLRRQTLYPTELRARELA
jgi:hypothetical protein